MESNTRQPDTSPRLRLAELTAETSPVVLQFDGGLAGVLTEPAERSVAARWIAVAAVGPESGTAPGDVAERLAAQQPLSSLLVPPGSPVALTAEDLGSHWQAVRARRCDELAAEHASRRLERHRTEAAIERASLRGAELSTPKPAAVNAPLSTSGSVDPRRAELRARVQALLVSIDALEPVASPEALALADEWDEHTALARVIDAQSGDYVSGFEDRVKVARMALAMSSGGFDADARAEIDRRHRLVVEAEAQLFEARRRNRAEAVARYEAAVAAEKVALGDAGVDSYASFLVTIAGGGGPVDRAAQQNARHDLEVATAALEAARGMDPVATRAEFEAKSIELRARAEALLRHAVVGGDPPAEMRALRAEAPGRADRVHELAATLAEANVESLDDPSRAAREFLEAEVPPDTPVETPADSSTNRPAWVPAAAFPSGPVDPATAAVRANELAALEHSRHEQETAVLELDAELARLARIRDAGIAGITADDLALVVDAVVDSYRAAARLGRRLPLVLDGALDGLSRESRETALEVLAATPDVQTIVVTTELTVMKSLTDAGGTIVLPGENPKSQSDSSNGASPNGADAMQNSWETRT